MFQENYEEIQQCEKQNSIPAGVYPISVTGTSALAAKQGKSGAILVEVAVSSGEFEGCSYTYFLTHSPKAGSVRAAFYKAIGYSVPSDGAVDENDWIGLTASAVIEVNTDGPRVKKLVAAEDASSADAPF
jgi:hypothetical protein